IDLVVQLAQAGAEGIAVHSAVRRGQEAVVAELLSETGGIARRAGRGRRYFSPYRRQPR
ncbi:unnamed protein product, partial [Ectocarpus sp. 12 AP-2014]